MIDVFRVSEKEVSGLGPDAFTDLMNVALRSEARSAGILSTDVHTSMRLTDADQGIDARVTLRADVRSLLIPSGESVWQYKSSDITPAEVSGEMDKPGVRSAVARGATYCLAIGRDMKDPIRNARKAAIEAKLQELKADPKQYRLYCADQIAEWWSQTPVTWLHPALQRPLGDGLWSLDQAFRVLPGSELPFVSDEHRTHYLAGVQTFLKGESQEQVLRVEGPTGMGKTRLVLEALRQAGVQDVAVYARSAEDVPSGLFTYLRERGVSSLVLVVDECEWGQGQRFAEMMHPCNPRCRLITIGPTRSMNLSGRALTGVYLLERLPDEDLRKVLQGFEPALSSGSTDMLVRLCSGVVKLAVLLGGELQKQPELQSYQLAQTHTLDNLLAQLFPEGDVRSVMGGISLARHVGWYGEATVEGQRLMGFVGVPWPKACQVVGDMVARGYVVARGRYIYVTPDVLAVWFGGQVWQQRSEEMMTLYEDLPEGGLAQAFLDRLSDSGDDPRTKEFCKRFFRRGDFFPDLRSLDDEKRAKMFSALALRMPSEGVHALRRILGSVSTDQLRGFVSGRRHTVWLLEKLAWLEETFEEAAGLLLLLARAENEDYGNNASGVWAGLFSTFLGGTVVPALQRHHLIDEALGDESPEVRRLAVRALEVAFAQTPTRHHGGENQGGRAVGAEWRPSTLGELRDVYRSGLRLLRTVLSDKDDTVRSSARQLMAGNVVHAFVHSGMLGELAATIRSDDWTRATEKTELRDSLHLVRTQHGDKLDAKQRELLDNLLAELVEKTFGERLRRWTGYGSFADWDQEDKDGGATKRQALEQLVSEALHEPNLLRAELGSLFSQESANGWVFARELGTADEEEVWREELLAAAKSGAGQTIAAAYLEGCAKRRGQEWLHDFLDQLAESQPGLAPVVFIASQTSSNKERSAKRMLQLVDGGLLPAENLGDLRFGAWTRSLSPQTVAELLDRLAKAGTASAVASGLSLLLGFVRHNPDSREALREAAWRLLEHPNAFSRQQTGEYDWSEVAASYLGSDPIRLVKAVLSARSSEGFPSFHGDRRFAVFAEASRKSPTEAWALVGPVLLADREAGQWKLWFALRGGCANNFPKELLLEWAELHKPEGPYVVAALAPVSGGTLSPLLREIVIRYRDDEDVLGAIVRNHCSGTFYGQTSDWYEHKAADAESWAKDEHPAIREWAKQLARGYREDAAKYRLAEEEEDLRF